MTQVQSTWDFRLLGSVQVLRAGATIEIGGRQRRALLALLLAHHDRVVSVSEIVAALWDEAPPATAVASIQNAVSALRAALGGPGGAILRTTAAGYQLQTDPGTVDMDRFRQAIQDASSALRADDAAAAAAHYRRALGQWSADALQDLRGMRFADEIGGALDEERLAGIEQRIGADLRLGCEQELVGEMTGLVRRFPLREQLWAHYLLVLYRLGRQADALAAFQDVRRRLNEDLGVEPGDMLQDLHSAILRQDVRLAAPARDRQDRSLTDLDLQTSLSGLLVLPDGRRISVGSIARLGRDTHNQVVVADSRASRQHAVVTRTASGYVVTDLNSSNGTRVNGAVIVAPTSLMDGDTISIGTVDVAFVVAADQVRSE